MEFLHEFLHREGLLFPKTLEGLQGFIKVVGIYETNFFGSGLGIKIARFNHSCCPNANPVGNKADGKKNSWNWINYTCFFHNLFPRYKRSKSSGKNQNEWRNLYQLWWNANAKFPKQTKISVFSLWIQMCLRTLWKGNHGW